MNKIFEKALGLLDRPTKFDMGLKSFATLAIALSAGSIAGAAINDQVREAQQGHELVLEEVAIRVGVDVVALAIADGLAMGASALLEGRRREETESAQLPSGEIVGE